VTSRRISLYFLCRYDNAVENSHKSSLQSIASKLSGELTLENQYVLQCVQRVAEDSQKSGLSIYL